MTTWINAGAHAPDGSSFKSKAALKRALKAGERVTLYTTGNFPNAEETVRAHDLGNRPNKASEAWSVVGPDPFTDRKWYATVTVNHLGNLVVK
jgi:hypothetical protein